MATNGNNNMLLLAVAGVGAFLLWKKQGGGKRRRGSVFVDNPEIISKEEFESQPDAIINAPEEKIGIPAAIEKAKQLASTLEDAFIVIKTGAKNIAIRKGNKKIVPTATRKVKTIKGKKTKRVTKKQKAAVKKLFADPKFKAGLTAMV